MSNIDRVLVSTDLDDKFSLTTLNALVRVGSDHNPLLLDTGERRNIQPGQFFFEKQWCLEEQFLEMVASKWEECKLRWPANPYSLDKWHGGLCNLRHHLKGWGRNIHREYKRKKSELLSKIQEIDRVHNEEEVAGNTLVQRAALEGELEKLMEK